MKEEDLEFHQVVHLFYIIAAMVMWNIGWIGMNVEELFKEDYLVFGLYLIIGILLWAKSIRLMMVHNPFKNIKTLKEDWSLFRIGVGILGIAYLLVGMMIPLWITITWGTDYISWLSGLIIAFIGLILVSIIVNTIYSPDSV